MGWIVSRGGTKVKAGIRFATFFGGGDPIWTAPLDTGADFALSPACIGPRPAAPAAGSRRPLIFPRHGKISPRWKVCYGAAP